MAESFIEIHYDSKDGITIRMRPANLKLVPESTLKHVRGAGKEMLLAMRSLLDQAIERVEESEEDQPTRRRKIKVEG